jgi:hypothetical protein
MGIRQTLQAHRGVAILVSFALMACASFGVVLHARSSADRDGQMAWFTDDDGKTRFPDDASKVPPFDHHGKPAVRCYVYTCGDGKQWVSHLLRYTPEGQKLREAAQPVRDFDPASVARIQSTVEVKLPGTGDKGWVKLSDPRGAAIQTPKCPHGTNHTIQAVEPTG